VKAGYTVLVVPGTGASQVLAGAATCNGTTSQSSYHATATPATLGQTGTRAFATNNSGSVYQNYTGVAIPASLAGARFCSKRQAPFVIPASVPVGCLQFRKRLQT